MSKSNPILCIDEIGLRKALRETILCDLIIKDAGWEEEFIARVKKEIEACQALSLPPWDFCLPSSGPSPLALK